MCTKGEENGGDHYLPTIQLLEAEYMFLEKNIYLTI